MPLASQMLVLTLVLALAMRFLVSILGLPGILNFAFFPVLIFGVLISRPRGTRAEIQIARAIVVVTLAVAASTLANFTNPLAAALLWASLVTPFLLIRLAVTQGHRLGSSWTLDQLITTFLFVQGAAIAFERFVLGKTGDATQGFLRNQGAGHHVVGFIGVGTAMYLAMRLIDEPTLRRRYSLYAAVLTGGAIGVITGTSQALLAGAVVGVTYLITRRTPWPIASSLLVSCGLVVVVFLAWSSIAPADKNWHGADFFANKSLSVTTVMAEYRDSPSQIFFGLGPGATTTKVAWTGASGFTNLTESLGLAPGRVAEELLNHERSKLPTRTSSLTSPWSTWLGVWGDLGLIGLVAYAWAWLAMARSTLEPSRTLHAGMYLVLYLVVLGIFYNWLEEPVLTIFLGLAVADAVVRASDSTSRESDSRSELTPASIS